MIADYKGFEIEVRREPSLAGYPLLYYIITRKSDGWNLLESFEDSNERIPTMMKYLKTTVDDYLENPTDLGGR